MAAKYKFILENEVISSTKGALVVVTAYWEALKMILEKLEILSQPGQRPPS